MNIIVCLDDKNGMLFNKRRQSSDRALRERIFTYCDRLFMNEYSSRQFEAKYNITVCADFLERAGEGQYCFVENTDIYPFIEKTEQIIIYRWNRVYPSDFKFPHVLLEKYKLVKTSEFKGNSHEKITEEIYKL